MLVYIWVVTTYISSDHHGSSLKENGSSVSNATAATENFISLIRVEHQLFPLFKIVAHIVHRIPRWLRHEYESPTI